MPAIGQETGPRTFRPFTFGLHKTLDGSAITPVGFLWRATHTLCCAIGAVLSPGFGRGGKFTLSSADDPGLTLNSALSDTFALAAASDA